MTEITLNVPAVPIAQPRQRTRVVNVRGKTFAQNYTPKGAPINAFKASVQHALAATYTGAPLEGPLALDLVFVFPRPGRLIWTKRPMPRVRHASRPDRDNLEKAVMDALNGLAWRDDSQVCDGAVSKWYAAKDEQPHVEITIRALEEQTPAPSPAPTLFPAEEVVAKPPF